MENMDLHVQGVLETANSIFKRFRNAFMSQSVNEDLAHSQQFVQPLLSTLQVGTLTVSPQTGAVGQQHRRQCSLQGSTDLATLPGACL